MEESYRNIVKSDSKGKPLDGGRNYKLHLPQDIQSSNYWSVIVYDSLNNLIIKNGQTWPSVHKNLRTLVVNQNGSVDVWFGPNKKDEIANNWIKTLPGKSWYFILRLYGNSLLSDNTAWRPGEIELMK